MAINSMTGFARSDGATETVHWHWELRCVNGKSLDIRCRLPFGYEALEPAVRKLVASKVSRGSCQISLSIKTQTSAGELTINEDALAFAVKAAQKLVKEQGVDAPSADGLLGLKGIVELVTPEEDGSNIKARNAAVMDSLDQALQDLITMRAQEGVHLYAILSKQVDSVDKLTASVREQSADMGDLMQKKVQRQVEQILSAQQSLDEDRLFQEAVIMASKADITEELDRLDAHVAAARQHLKASGPIGRKLEFLIQEFNREANTLCSKSPTTDITTCGLEMKTLIDQMREQVMNIE